MTQGIRLTPSIYILKESNNVYRVVYTGTRKVKRFEFDSLIKDAIESVKSNHSLEAVVADLSKRHDPRAVILSLQTLETEGIVRTYGVEKQNPRYERQVAFLDEITNSHEEAVALQSKLERSTVGVCGVGGIGSWVVNGLFQIGIGNIRITDPDVVNTSNLNRQLHYHAEDVGIPKVSVLKSRLPDAKITTFALEIKEDVSLDEFVEGCDFLVNCADAPSVQETTRILHPYAKKRKIPYSIAGGYNMHLGMVGPVIVPGETACFECFLTYQKERDSLSHMEKIKDVEQAGNLGPIAGVISNLHVMEVFKFLTGKGETNKNKFAEIDCMVPSIEWRTFTRRDDCKVCGGEGK